MRLAQPTASRSNTGLPNARIKVRPYENHRRGRHPITAAWTSLRNLAGYGSPKSEDDHQAAEQGQRRSFSLEIRNARMIRIGEADGAKHTTSNVGKIGGRDLIG